MSARKIATTELLQPVTVQARTTRLELPASAVRVRKSGIEFRSADPIPELTEMTIGLQTPEDAKKINFTGVVVACKGSRHTGFNVSVLITNMPPRAQARLEALTYSP